MDAKKTGTFIAGQRKSLGMTQLELAERLHITDKAVSRWERGKGFPDIVMLEPLSEALTVSIAELLKGEKSAESSPDGAESLAAKDVISLVELKRKEYGRIAVVSAASALLLFCVLLIDNMGLMGFIGAALPCLGFIAGLALACAAVIRWKRKLPVKATVVWAAILISVPVIFIILFAAAGMLGVGPVPN